MSSETKITEADRQALESGNQEIGLTAHYDNNTKSVQIPLNVKVGDKYVLNTTGKRVAKSDYIVFLADGETEQQVRARLQEKGINNPTVLGSVSQDGFVAKEPTPSFTSIQPPKPAEPTTTQPGEAANDETLQQLIGAGNKAEQNNGAALEALAWVGNIFRHIPIGVGMVAKETIEAGERFYDRTWAQRGDAALSWGRNVALAASNLNIQSIAKANFNAYASYLYNPEPFNSFAADRSQNGLSAQLGIGIGKNLTYGAATGAALSPFAGGGGATSIFPEGVPTIRNATSTESTYKDFLPQARQRIAETRAKYGLTETSNQVVGMATSADEAYDMAFGFTHNLTGSFKKQVPQARNYLDLGLNPYSPNFSSQLLSEMGSAKNIHFDLTGMRMINSSDGILNGPAHLNPGGSTNWELRTIWDNPSLRSKTTFYRDGKVLSIEEVKRLP